MARSVMEKAKSHMISIGKEGIVNKVDAMHNILKTKLNGGNKQTAKEAEYFLNWLIFDKQNSSLNTFNKEYRNELLKNPTIKNIISKFNEYILLSQEYSEKLSLSKKISEEAFKNVQKDYGEFAYKRGIETEEMFIKLINAFTSSDVIKSSGQDSATVIVDKWAKNFMMDIGLYGEENIKKLIKDNENLRYAYRDMKADAQSNGNIEYVINIATPEYLNSCIKVFSNVSLKSVNDIKSIHLEEVDINKAYVAFMNFAYKNKYLSQKAIKNIFNDYYKEDNVKDYEYVTRHLNHLFRVYAYSGFGTSPLSDLDSISKGVEYLVVVDNVNKYIYIKSSSEVIDFLLTYNRAILKPNVVLNLQTLLNHK